MGVSKAPLRASWGVLGASWGHLGPSWGPLGGLLARLGGVLGRLGGQDPTRARGTPFFSVFSSRFGLIFERFLDGFWDDFSRLVLHYPTRPQHVEKPKKYYFSSTGGPFEVLHVQYF